MDDPHADAPAFTANCVALRNIWAQVLHTEVARISDTKNFYEQGGDSLLMLQVLAKCKSAGMALTLRQFISSPTILALAPLISSSLPLPPAAAPAIDLEADVPAADGQSGQAGPRSASFILSPAQQELIDTRKFQKAYHYTILNVSAEVTLAVLQAGFQSLVERHAALTLSLTKVGGRWEQCCRSAEQGPFFVVGHAADLDACMAAASTMDIAGGPLLIGNLLEPESGGARVFVACHALALDLASWSLIIDDLYAALAGKIPAGVSKPALFSDFLSATPARDVATMIARGDVDRWFAQLSEPRIAALDLSGWQYQAAQSSFVDIPLGGYAQGQDAEVLALALSTFALARLLECSHLVVTHLQGERTSEQWSDKEFLACASGSFPFRYEVEVGNFAAHLQNTAQAKRANEKIADDYALLKYFGPRYVADQLIHDPEISFQFSGKRVIEAEREALERFPIRSSMAQSMPGRGVIHLHAWITGGALRIELCMPQDLSSVFPPIMNFGEVITAVALAGARPEVPAANVAVTPFQREILNYGAGTQRYVLQRRVALAGAVDQERFRLACQALVARHEILASRYVFDNRVGNYVRIFDPQAVASVTVVRCTDAADLETHCAQQSALGFRFEEDYPIRFMLAFGSDEASHVVITSHHLILDGTSFQLLIDDLYSFYQKSVLGEDLSAMAPAQATYAQYEAWVGKQDIEAARQYWRSRMARFDACRFDISATAAKSSGYRQHKQLLILPRSVLQSLQRENLSVSVAVNFVFSLMLSRYLATTRVVLGNTVSLRPAEIDGVEGLIGPCIATMPVALDLATRQSATLCMRDMQLQVLESREKAYLGLMEIATALGKGTLFDANYSFQNLNVAIDAHDKHLSAAALENSQLSSHFPLTLSAVLAGEQLGLFLAYRVDTLRPYQIEHLMAGMSHALTHLSEWLDLPVADIDVLAATQVDGKAIAAAIDGASEATLPPGWLVQQFKRMAIEHADRVAVIDVDDSAYTYRDLDIASNRIAHALGAGGVVGAVGIAMHPSFSMIASVWGVLKAGGHFVSLETDFPIERVRWICQTLNVGTVLAGLESHERLHGLAPRLIVADRLFDSDATFACEVDAPAYDDKALCVAHYTSGSTGLPKLVLSSLVAHANRIDWLQRAYPASSDDVFCLKSKLAFAPSVREILEPHTQGKPVYILPQVTSRDMHAFVERMNRHRVSRIYLTPSFVRILLDSGCLHQLSALRHLELSSEPVPVDLAHQVLNELPDVRLVNRYGATEAPHTFYKDLSRAGLAALQSLICPVATPIRNTSVHVIDASGRVLPKGCVGEILIISQSAARGYSDPVLTAEVFASVDQGPHAPALSYKTGDMGWIDDRHDLYFLARRTRMIKRAGYRIEPREIEIALERHESVSRCVVHECEIGGTKKLIAFVTACASGATLPERTELHAFAAQDLPAYMLPNDYVVIEAFPIHGNGKVNFNALQELLNSSQKRQDGGVLSATETKLLSLFKKVLGNDHVHVLDDLFDLGADSLLALRVAHEVSVAFGKKVDIDILYLKENIRQLGRYLDGGEAGVGSDVDQPNSENYVAMLDSGSGPVICAFPPAGGNAHSYRSLLPYLPHDLSFYAFAPLDRPRDASDWSIEVIAKKYVQPVLELANDRPLILLGWSLGGTLAYAVATQLVEAGLKPDHLLLIDPGINTSSYDDNINRDALLRHLNAYFESVAPSPEDAEAIITRMLGDVELIKNYRPRVYRGEVTLVKPKSIIAVERNFDKPFNGFERLALGDLAVRTVGGNHMTMMAQFAAEVADIVVQRLHAVAAIDIG